jgi:putative membrane protein
MPALTRKIFADTDWLAFAVLVLAGACIDTATRLYPMAMPYWMPWEFSWPVFLGCALGLHWYARGLSRLYMADRPALWRIVSFALGIFSFYAVLQTHIDYAAQHMFFIHRAAHFVLHHVGAFLIVFGLPARPIYLGMPSFLRPVCDAPIVRKVMDVLQHPVMAPMLFVGLLYFWLIPALHTRVMLDINLYEVMNLTMAINGVMFWSLVLDPRPHPPARLSSGIRAILIIVIELPQMLLGAILSLSTTDFYPVYRICGRIFDMTALNDMHYGGLIIWLPSTLMSFVAMICVLNNMRLNEEAAERERQRE